MKKVFYLAGFFVLSSAIVGLSIPRKYTIYNNWSNIKLVDTLVADQLSDTLVAFCSNRGFHHGKEQFLDFSIHHDSLTFFLATFKKGTWWVDKVQNLKAALYYFPDRDYVAYVEGMGKTFPLNLQRSSAMAAQYNVNVIMFDYPSIHPEKSMFGNFRFAYNNAENSWKSYYRFLEDIRLLREGKNEPLFGQEITLFHHSMGNLMIRKLMEQKQDAFNDKIFDNLVLNAACVPQKNHKEWVEKIGFADRIYINYNRKDYQLNGAMLLTFDKMLGTRPGKPFADNAIYVDFHDLVDKRHSNFLNIEGREAIPRKAHYFYFSLLHGEHPDVEDPLHYLASENASGEPDK